MPLEIIFPLECLNYELPFSQQLYSQQSVEIWILPLCIFENLDLPPLHLFYVYKNPDYVMPHSSTSLIHILVMLYTTCQCSVPYSSRMVTRKHLLIWYLPQFTSFPNQKKLWIWLGANNLVFLSKCVTITSLAKLLSCHKGQ